MGAHCTVGTPLRCCRSCVLAMQVLLENIAVQGEALWAFACRLHTFSCTAYAEGWRGHVFSSLWSELLT